MPAKKSKKPSKPDANLWVGISTNLAVGPLGFRAALDINPKDEDNPEPSRVVFGEIESRAQETLAPGPSSAVAMRDIEQDDRTTRGNIGQIRQEDEPAMEPKVPEQERGKTTFEAPIVRNDVEEAASSGFGTLKSLLEAIYVVYANREESVVIKDKIGSLLSRVASLDALFATRPGDIAEQRRRSGVIRELKDVEGQLRLLSEESGPQWLINHAQHDEDVLGLLEDLREAIFHYQMVRRTRIGDEGFRPIDPAESVILNNLRYAQKAEFRHGSHDRCLKGTRRTVLDEIELWTRDFHKPPVYWLNGLAGTGKSTIARTVAERAFADGKLGASFFCSRDFEDLRNLQFIFPTIAAQLARRYTEFRAILVPLVQSDPEVVHESLYGQMDKLVVQPLVESAISTVIVIDALDECEDDEPASAILSVLGQFVNEIPKVKFFVTGRPEPRIRNGFRLPLLAKEADIFVLHEVNSGQVNNDIRLFYRHNCSEIQRRRQGLDGWPTEEQLDLLCDRAAGLFIYAMATLRFIDQKNQNPKKQLDLLIRSQESVSEGKIKLRANMTLDSLYMSILHEAFGDNDPRHDPKVQSVLGAVILATNPLSPSAIAALLGLDPGDVSPVLSSVHSLLVLPEDITLPVQPFHKSFPDFLIDMARCTDSRFHICPPDQHTELLVGCLGLMNQKLEQNMCKLPNGVTNMEVKDLKQRTEQHIDKSLEYACRSWYKHLSNVTSTQMLKITPILHQFLEEKFLFWLEVLSVLGATREAVDALKATEKWLNVSETLELTTDYIHFILKFFDVISTSASHIYISALPLSPQTSIVCKLYKQYASPPVRIVQGLPISWDPVLATMYDEDFQEIATWSPCSRFIAVAKSTTIEILDAATLEKLKSFKTLQKCELLSFSPDGCTLTQFGSEKLTSWDLQTGGQVVPAFLAESNHLYSGDAFSVTYSIDGNILAVSNTSYYGPTCITTYNLLAGTHTHPYHPPEGDIVPPIWTHGECLRFVTVKPGAITVWEAAFASVHTPVMLECFAAPDEILDVKYKRSLFLPALSYLAFAVSDRILVWDAQDSRFLLRYGPSLILYCTGPLGMAFSSDGCFFSYAVHDREVFIWKRSLDGYILHQRLDFSPFSMRLHFSPNGESIITVNNSSIYLWHTEDRILPLPNVPGHGDRKGFILEFSPDEELAAFAHYNEKTVTILDLQSGNPHLTIDTGMRIRCLRITRSSIAVAGWRGVVTWNLPARNCVTARAGIDDSVHTTITSHTLSYSKSISPDLSYVAFTTFNHIIIGDLPTGRQLAYADVSNSVGWIALTDCEVWHMAANGSLKGWNIIRDNQSSITKLEPLETTTCLPQAFPWQSHCGYKVTHDGWVLGPTQKRLMWLPHHWRSNEKTRVWSGQFLGLGHSGLQAAVILEFFD